MKILNEAYRNIFVLGVVFALVFLYVFSGLVSAGSSAGFRIEISAPSQCSPSAETSGGTEYDHFSSGSYALANGGNLMEITIAENSYTENLRFIACSYANDNFVSSKPAPSEKSFVGKTYKLIFMDSGEVNTIETLLLPATVVLTYTDMDISGVDENKIAPYRWGSGDSSWQLIPDSVVNTANNTVTFSTANFSAFVLLGESPSEGGEETPSSSSSRSVGRYYIHKPDLPTCDFNDDSLCNFRDLSIMLYWFEKSGSAITRYDLNGDGEVNFKDISILLYRWKE